MEATIYVARAMGLFFTIVGIPLLFCSHYAVSNFKEAVSHKGVFFLAAVMTLIIGILLILSQATWRFNWQGLVTLLSWIIFFNGLIRLFFMNKVQSWVLSFISVAKFRLMGIIVLIIGLFLLYSAFIAVNLA